SSSSSSSSSFESQVVQALGTRGWCFRDLDQIRGLIDAQSPTCTADSIESELLNIDLRSIGGKCLPEPSVLRKISHLQGPIVLQVCSCRDISRSSVADASGNSGGRRLLKLKLTDGHSEISSVESSHVPSIPDDISPGTKVRLVGKVDIYNGMLCLNKKVITILGGVVQSLFDEWQLKRKYMNVTRYASRVSQESESNCPPPFEKLQIGASTRGTTSTPHTYVNKGHCSSNATGSSEASSSDSRQTLDAKGELSRIVQLEKHNATMDNVTSDAKKLDDSGDNTEKPSCSSTRPKVTATTTAPIQNQAAALKLLQKASQPNPKDRTFRNQRHRGKFKEEDPHVLTLDEWERRKTGVDLTKTHEHVDVSRDEDLARQLQKQFELEDIHAQKDPLVVDPESIKMSMFSFERNDARANAGTEFRGRGRGRGRGRRRGGRY
ncbi:hypothetical protein STAS_13450, partial [Striga asiatica]